MKNKANKGKTTMTVREVAVLIEGLRSDFRTFGEGLDALRAKVDSMFDQLGKLTENVFIIKADIAEIKEMLKTHDRRISQLEAVK